MKKFLLTTVILSILTLFASCGSDKKEPEMPISLSATEIEIPYNETSSITVNCDGEFEYKLEDGYFVDIYPTSNTIFSLKGSRVGETTLVASNNTNSASCKIKVTPTINNIGIPYIDFSASIQNIKDNMNGLRILSEQPDFISFVDSDVPYSPTHRYYFTNNKLDHIITLIELYKFSNDNTLSGLLSKVSSSLSQRYDYEAPYHSINQDIYIYKYKTEYYIGARLKGGNGGWYVCYAPTKEQVIKILDTHPSISPS